MFPQRKNRDRPTHQSYTYQDYLSWDDDERWEIIHGEPFLMPAPTRKHQQLLVKISNKIYNHIENSSCEVYVAPFDVRLSNKEEDEMSTTTVVQPDICVFLDDRQLDEKGATGAPDLIVEILSPSTALKDLNYKLPLFEAHKVKEYWMVYTDWNFIEVHRLNEQGEYNRPIRYFDEIPVSLLDIPLPPTETETSPIQHLVINVKEVFGIKE